jgi:hypothetical protein
MIENQYPTETVELPSKGLGLYPEGHPLASGEVQMKYMTAYHEDILTNTNYLKQGIAIDKLLEALIVDKISIDEFLVGDKNALMIGARILGYGPDYEITVRNPSSGLLQNIKVDLTQLDFKEVDKSLYNGQNAEVDFILPVSKKTVTLKLLDGKIYKAMNAEINGLKKLRPEESFEVTLRLKHIIAAVDENRDLKTVRSFVDSMRPGDSLALRKFHVKITPDVNMTIKHNFDGYGEEDIEIPFGMNFFWPSE